MGGGPVSPSGYVACVEHGVIGTAPTLLERSRMLARHWDGDHLGRAATITQLPGVDWHTEAMTGLLTLCRSGRPFVVSEVIRLGVPDAPNPRTDWPRVQREARDNGWMVATGRLGHSVRPSTNGSPVTEWIGVLDKLPAVAA